MSLHNSTRLCVDLRQFFSNPTRTGVQRVIKELLFNWDTNNLPFELQILAQIDNELYWLNLNQTIELIDSIFNMKGSPHEPIPDTKLRNFRKTSWPLCLLEVDKWLIPEPSLDRELIRSWEVVNETMPTVFIFYDCLPLKNPEFFDLQSVILFSNYVRLICNATSVIAISNASTTDLLKLTDTKSSHKIRVSHLSGKHKVRNLEIENSIQRILVLSTIEKRKNIRTVIDAFDQLSKFNSEAQLVVCGKAGNDFETVFHLKEANNQVIWVENPTDEDLHELLQSSSVLVSIGLEGFGLPVLEALELSVPVIVSQSQPVTEVLSETGGVIVLTEPTVMQLLNSMSYSLQPSHNQILRQSIDKTKLPEWATFANSVASACFDASFEN